MTPNVKLKPGKLYRNIKPIMITYRKRHHVETVGMIRNLYCIFMAVNETNKVLYKNKLVTIAFQDDIDNGIEEITDKKEYMEKVAKEINKFLSLSA